MSIGTLMQTLNKPLTEDILIPAKGNFDELYTQEVQDFIVERFEVPEEAIFLSKTGEDRGLVIVEKPYAFTVRQISIEYMDFIEDDKRYKMMKHQCLSMFQKDEYEEFFEMNEDLKTIFMIYSFVKDKFDVERRYKILKKIYITNEYGFNEGLIEEFITLYRQLPNPDRSFEKSLESLVDEEGYIPVYRGQESESTPVEKAISWTHSHQTALFFSSRYTAEGRMFRGRVKLSNVLEYISSSNEKEIISDKVEDVVEYDFYHPKSLIDGLSKQPLSPRFEVTYYDLFNNELVEFDKTLFKSPDGIHGYLHMKRVFLHSMVLANKIGIIDKDVFILSYASQYHDIGRINDGVDLEHGLRSWQKVKKLNLVSFGDNQDLLITKFIIEYHNIDDVRALKRLKNSPIQDKDRAWKLYSIFCDADNLDRVRIGDLDESYLRTEEAPKMVMFARSCLKYIVK